METIEKRYVHTEYNTYSSMVAIIRLGSSMTFIKVVTSSSQT